MTDKKEMTLRGKLESILEQRANKAAQMENGSDKFPIGCFGPELDTDQATDQIFALLREELPKEKPHYQFLTKENIIAGTEGARTIEDWQKKGWNTYRQEMLRILEIK
jgi:hypothetical protein